MRKLISVLCGCLALSFFFVASPLTAYASTPIDLGKEASLTLQYRHNEMYFEGMEINTYQIAEVFSDGTG